MTSPNLILLLVDSNPDLGNGLSPLFKQLVRSQKGQHCSLWVLFVPKVPLVGQVTVMVKSAN